MNEKRLEYVDVAKAFGIFLVVVGHFKQNEWDMISGTYSLTKWIYSFHMPFFFIIAGYVSHTKVLGNSIEFRAWVLKIFSRYFLPYLLMMLVCNGIDFHKLYDYFIPRQGGLVKYCYTLASWWLPCFIVVHCIVQICDNLISWTNKKIINNASFAFLLLSIGFCLQGAFSFRNIPYYANISVVGAGLFLLGRVIRKYSDQYSDILAPPQRAKVVTVCAFVMLAMLFNTNTTIYMVIGEYGNPVLFLVNGIIGSVLLLFLGKVVTGRVWTYIGRNSIVILMYHGLAIAFVDYIISKYMLFTIPSDYLFSFRIILSLFCVIFMIPLIYFINNFIPELAGKTKGQR